MATRTVADTLRYLVDPWQNQDLTFTLLTPVATVDGLYMPRAVTATTDSDGAFTVALPVPDDDDSAAPYQCRLPSGLTFAFALSPGVGTVALGTLLTQAITTGTPNDLQVLIDAHAALEASTTVSGHATVDGTTITATNGVLSAVGGGGAPSGPAGGVLSGTYPDPVFAVDMATQAELNAEAATRASADTTNATAISTHIANTSNPHATTAAQAGAYTTGQADTAISSAVSTHNSDTSAHGQTAAGRAVLTAATLAAQKLLLNVQPRTISFRAQYANTNWTSQPLAEQELFNSASGRIKADLTNATEARLFVRVGTAGTATAIVYVQYSTDESSWNTLDGSTGPQISLAVGSSSVVSGWVTLAAGAKADVFLRVAGSGGNGSTSPSIGTVALEVR